LPKGRRQRTTRAPSVSIGKSAAYSATSRLICQYNACPGPFVRTINDSGASIRHSHRPLRSVRLAFWRFAEPHMAGNEAQPLELEPCPECRAPASLFDITRQEHSTGDITEITCRICGYSKAQLIVPERGQDRA